MNMKQILIRVLQAAVLSVLVCLFSGHMYAAGISPVGRWLSNAANEATNIWAVSGTIVALVVGLLGMLFGEHHVKEWATKAVIISVCLLSVQGLIEWFT